MRVLVGCEESGVVRRAFRALGHDAWSCDLLPARDGGEFHIGDDVRMAIKNGCPSSLSWVRNGGRGGDPWDLAIFFPPCTDLAGSGARWLTDHWVHKNGCPGRAGATSHHMSDSNHHGCRWHDGSKKRAAQKEGLALFHACFEAGIPRIACENPVGMLSTLYRKPDQIIQPWMFGHPETKATCLWLKNTRGGK